MSEGNRQATDDAVRLVFCYTAVNGLSVDCGKVQCRLVAKSTIYFLLRRRRVTTACVFRM